MFVSEYYKSENNRYKLRSNAGRGINTLCLNNTQLNNVINNALAFYNNICNTCNADFVKKKKKNYFNCETCKF